MTYKNVSNTLIYKSVSLKWSYLVINYVVVYHF